MEPNYTMYRGVEATTLVLALLLVIFRLVNRVIRKTVSFDDGILLLATALAVIITVFLFQLYHYGYGSDDDLIADSARVPIGKLSLAIFSLFPTCYSLIRTSIILTYLRLFPAQTNRWFCYGLFVTQVAYAITAGLLVLLQCKPIEAYWRFDIERDCVEPRNQDVGILVFNSFFDLIVYLWPAHYLYKLNLPVKSRIGLVLLFSLGIANLGLSFARLSMLLVMYDTQKWTTYGPPGCMMIVLEAHIGIMCACLPYVRFVYDFIATKVFGRVVSTFTTKMRTKSKSQNNANEDGSHPFQQLNEDGKGIRVERKTDVVITTLHDEEMGDDQSGRAYTKPDSLARDELDNESGERVLLDGKRGLHAK